MKSYMWDTGALTQFFAGHVNAKKIMEQIITAKSKGFVPLLIVAEFYYKQWEKLGEHAARLRATTILNSQLTVVSINSSNIYRIGELKVKRSRLSLADCVVLTLGENHKSVVLTTDEGLCKISGIKAKKLDY